MEVYAENEQKRLCVCVLWPMLAYNEFKGHLKSLYPVTKKCSSLILKPFDITKSFTKKYAGLSYRDWIESKIYVWYTHNPTAWRKCKNTVQSGLELLSELEAEQKLISSPYRFKMPLISMLILLISNLDIDEKNYSFYNFLWNWFLVHYFD